MPVHNWKKANAGLFHHFHQSWAKELCDGLNAGVLPSGHFALIEQWASGVEPDVLTLSWNRGGDPPPRPTGVTVAASPPPTRYVRQMSETQAYALRANRVGVRTTNGDLIAVVEIVSPGNKDRTKSLQDFIDKTNKFLSRGVHVLVIDLFPPTPRDPHGIHRVIWDDDDFTPPADKPLTLAAYVGEPGMTAYVEPVAVGDPLPPMPIFLDADTYIPAPLEETYQRTWDKCPQQMKDFVLNPTT